MDRRPPPGAQNEPVCARSSATPSRPPSPLRHHGREKKGWGTIHALFDRPDTDFLRARTGTLRTLIAETSAVSVGSNDGIRRFPAPWGTREAGAIPRWDTARAAGKAQPAWLFTRAEGIMTDIGRMAHVVPARNYPSARILTKPSLPASKNSFSSNPRSTSATRSWCPKWGLAYPGPGKRRACAGSQPARRRSHLKCLPPPSGADAWRRNRQRGRQLQHARQPEGHRGNIVCPCTAGPTTTRASCWARLSLTPRPA